MSASIYLAPIADDFGASRAANSGIIRAFKEGILTGANIMPPREGFAEAVDMYHEAGIPLGFHLTVTSEDGGGPVKPLTRAPSMTRPDGRFKHDTFEIWSESDPDEFRAEMESQYQKLVDAGITCDHVVPHRGSGNGELMTVVDAFMRREKIPFEKPMNGLGPQMPQYRWESVVCVSSYSTDYEERKARLRGILDELTPGYHLWVLHPADPDVPAGGFAPGSPLAKWNAYPPLDFKLLVDDDIKRWIDERNIEVVPLARCPVINL